MSRTTASPPDAVETAPAGHPSLVVLLDQILEQLTSKHQLGLLSVSVLRRTADEVPDRWEDYEAILREIAVFVDRFRARRMRRTDILLEPLVAGNTYVVLMGPPRTDRRLTPSDVHRVRHRLARGLRRHLANNLNLDSGVVEHYGVYVGGSLVDHDPTADHRRMIYRGLEEAVADALDQSRRDGTLHAARLDRILRGGQVSTVYQPVVDMFQQQVIGFEALTRVPNDLFRSPELIFKVANEAGNLWNLERLCRQRAIEGLPTMSGSQKLFINLEPNSFYDPYLRQRAFIDTLAEVGLDPSRIVFELTEHAAVQDFVALRKVLDDVRSLGYLLALDDVGSGYSGLQTIAEIRPDYLKVDMTLIRNLHVDPLKRELIATIRRFADSTDITLVAEGVETVEELESLASAGVRCAQGFLFARPDSPPKVPDWDLITPDDSDY